MTAASSTSSWPARRPAYTLPQALHLDPEVYRLELERIWRRGWLFAAHTAELRHAGDRAVFDVGDDSALIVRGEDGDLRAFHNVCRHAVAFGGPAIASFAGRLRLLRPQSRRGAAGAGRPLYPLPLSPVGLSPRRLSGRVRGHGPHGRLRPAANGLCPLDCAEVGGLVFVRFEPPAAARRPAERQLEPDIYELAGPLLPQGLERAKVAYSQTYLVGAGWKVVWENNRECWHCHVGHPEYIKSHFDTANTASPEVQQRIAARTTKMVEALSRPGGRRCLRRRRAGYLPVAGAGVVGAPDASGGGVRHRVARRRTRSASDGRLPELRRRDVCACGRCRTSGATPAPTTP